MYIFKLICLRLDHHLDRLVGIVDALPLRPAVTATHQISGVLSAQILSVQVAGNTRRGRKVSFLQ